MEDDKFFEIREKLVETLHSFKDECVKQGVNFDTEMEDILYEMET